MQINTQRKSILVTGGTGFLGAHLCKRLLDAGHEVLCVDNFFSSSRSNVAELMDNPRFELLRHDICIPLYVEVNEIYNLACPASPIHYQHDPVQTIKTCVNGATNMLGLAKRVHARIFQASTSEVYGDPEVHPQVESYWGHVNPNGIRSCYDEGKRCAEALFFSYWRQHNISITGGSDYTKYLVSGSYFRQNGIIKENDVTRATLRINLDQKITSWMNLGVNLSLSRNTLNAMASSETPLPILRFCR